MSDNNTADMHKNHRNRLRARYKRDGINSLEDYRALEMFLFYCIPVKDTYPIAHDLLKRFGSIDGVFSAEEEALCEVKGVGVKTAERIRYTGQLMQRVVADTLSENPFNSEEQIMCYLLWVMRPLEIDAVVIMYLDRKNRLIECKNYSTPRNSYINVFDDIRKKAGERKTLKIVAAHKHPEGSTEPSFTDIGSTEKLMRICREAGVSLIEHYIVSGYTCYAIIENDFAPSQDT